LIIYLWRKHPDWARQNQMLHPFDLLHLYRRNRVRAFYRHLKDRAPQMMDFPMAGIVRIWILYGFNTALILVAIGLIFHWLF
jgi:hypothetical protein